MRETRRLDKLPEKVIVPQTSFWNLRLDEAWRSRELMWELARRNIATRYAQMVLGIAWAGLEPLAIMLMMVVVFGIVLKLPSDGVPYPIFVIVGLAPFQLFSKTTLASTYSLIENMGVISKVYFPRLILPISNAIRELVTNLAPLLVLVLLMILYDVPVTWRLCALPLALLYAFMLGLGVGYWLAATIVRYRDIGYILNIALQLLAYFTPVAYSPSLFGPLRWIFELNPVYWAIALARWSVFGQDPQLDAMFYTSISLVLVILVSGLFVFTAFERGTVDIQ